ncbi:MAG: MarR family transcriptional regulator [Oligoflexia bacterium]|nr:MarR family transcriptional regulator [Oligoflexia bacterium]
MRMISNSVSYSFARKLNASGVTVAEWVILREMYGSGDKTSPSTVAEISGLTRGAVSKLITRLLEKNLVHRRECSEDRRYQEIELTKNGKSLVPKLSLLADRNDEEFFSGLSNKERNQLIVLLKKLAQIHQLKNLPIE